MAKDKTAKPPKKKSPLGWMLLCLPIIGSLGFFYSPLILLLIAMAPTLFAALFDQNDEKSLAVCIGAGNLAGAVALAAPQFLHPLSLDAVLINAQSPMTWLAALGGATVGAGIFYLVPLMVVETVYMKNVAQKKYLFDQQSKLVENWGEGVKNDS